MAMTALERHQFRSKAGLEECIACGGSGKKSRPGPNKSPECAACEGTGGIRVVTETRVVQHSSESVEHYTPDYIVEPCRKLLGEIDLDPASCPMGQKVVQAHAWYGPGSEHGEDGLALPWLGRVFLNPPGGLVPEEWKGCGTDSFATLWWGRLVSAWEQGEVESAIFVGFTLEILRSAQTLPVLQPLHFPFCVPSSRIPFDTINRRRTKGKKKGELIDPSSPSGARVKQSQPGHANVLVWLPPVDLPTKEAAKRLTEAMGDLGACCIGRGVDP